MAFVVISRFSWHSQILLRVAGRFNRTLPIYMLSDDIGKRAQYTEGIPRSHIEAGAAILCQRSGNLSGILSSSPYADADAVGKDHCDKKGRLTHIRVFVVLNREGTAFAPWLAWFDRVLCRPYRHCERLRKRDGRRKN